MRQFKTIIMAAGKGTRMKSDLPKVIHKLNMKPMVQYVVDSANQAGSSKNYLVVGYKKEMVMNEISNSNCDFSIQEEQLGTGHAVMMAENQLHDYDGAVVILSGDVPLIKANTIEKMVDYYADCQGQAVVATIKLEDPKSYGRIVRNNRGQVVKIVEAKDASKDELNINEINTGIYVFDSKALFKALNAIEPNNKQKEYYLTDTVEILLKNKQSVYAYVIDNAVEVQGVNTIEELNSLEKLIP